TDAALGVAGSVENVRCEVTRSQRFAICDARFDGNCARRGHAEPGRLYVEHFQQRVVILVEQDGRPRQCAQLHGSAYVIDVGVGDDDLLHFQLVLADDGENVFNVIARIDDHGLVRGLVSDDGAVALQRAYGQDLVDHRFIFAQGSTIRHFARLVWRSSKVRPNRGTPQSRVERGRRPAHNCTYSVPRGTWQMCTYMCGSDGA